VADKRFAAAVFALAASELEKRGGVFMVRWPAPHPPGGRGLRLLAGWIIGSLKTLPDQRL
jgi:hypothetical protein